MIDGKIKKNNKDAACTYNLGCIHRCGHGPKHLCHHYHGLATKGQQRQAPTLDPSGTLEIAHDYLLFTMFIRFSPKLQLFAILFQGFFT